MEAGGRWAEHRTLTKMRTRSQIASDARSNEKRTLLLGISIGTATARLRKAILFRLVVKCGEDICYRCGKRIETVEELSIEHKAAWMSAADPVAAFFDQNNLSFSHHACNVGAASQPNKKYATQREYKRAESARYYEKNKDRWNQIRNARRRRGIQAVAQLAERRVGDPEAAGS